jgi:hypothetical protein
MENRWHLAVAQIWFQMRRWFIMLTKKMRKASTLVEPHHASL